MKSRKPLLLLWCAPLIFILPAFAAGCGEKSAKDKVSGKAAETRRLKYVVKDDNGIIGFFNDGSAVTGRWHDINDATLETLYNEEPSAAYKELPDGIALSGGDEIKFSDDDRAISSKWAMIDYSWIHSYGAVTDYSAYGGIFHSDDILKINDTCFIEMTPETKTFENEESEEADAYFAAMDDHAYYINEIRSKFENIGVKNTITENRYLVFTLKGGSQIIVDTLAEQNGKRVKAFLYKKGKLPLIVNIADSNMEQYKYYLQN